MNRRQFLKQSVISGSALILGSSLYACSDLSILETDLIDDEVSVALHAILPVFLAGALADDQQQRQQQLVETITAMRQGMLRLAPHILDELQSLFALLNNRLANLAYLGTLTATQHFSVAQATALIEGWRTSYLAVLNSAYDGLKELIFAAFYGQQQQWTAINYQQPDLGV